MAKSPLAWLPSAIMHAPVSVATSMIVRGLKVCAWVRASHKTNRPSASVFKISTVLPELVVTISPGRVAPPLGMFSAAATIVKRLIGSLASMAAFVAPKTAAAPPMSYFISSIVGGGLREMPPVSKVIPLPTSAMGA